MKKILLLSLLFFVTQLVSAREEPWDKAPQDALFTPSDKALKFVSKTMTDYQFKTDFEALRKVVALQYEKDFLDMMNDLESRGYYYHKTMYDVICISTEKDLKEILTKNNLHFVLGYDCKMLENIFEETEWKYIYESYPELKKKKENFVDDVKNIFLKKFIQILDVNLYYDTNKYVQYSKYRYPYDRYFELHNNDKYLAERLTTYYKKMESPRIRKTYDVLAEKDRKQKEKEAEEERKWQEERQRTWESTDNLDFSHIKIVESKVDKWFTGVWYSSHDGWADKGYIINICNYGMTISLMGTRIYDGTYRVKTGYLNGKDCIVFGENDFIILDKERTMIDYNGFKCIRF